MARQSGRTTAGAVLACALASGCASAPQRVAPLRLAPPVQKVGDGTVWLDCAFDGKPAPCQLDTGSGANILVPRKPPFDAYPAARAGSNVDSLGGRTSVDYIRVARLTVGDAVFGPVLAKRRGSADAYAERYKTPALIGPQALARRSFALRFTGGPPELAVDGPRPAAALHPLLSPRRDRRDRHLLMNAALGGTTAVMLFDTGTGLTEIDRDFVAAHPAVFGDPVAMMRIPGRPDSPIYRLPPVTLGGARFDGILAIASDFTLIRKMTGAGVVVMLGYDVAVRADWYFDLAHRRWAVWNARQPRP
jgi:hypothetical protein